MQTCHKKVVASMDYFVIQLRFLWETFVKGTSLIHHVRLIHELVHIQTEAVSSGFVSSSFERYVDKRLETQNNENPSGKNIQKIQHQEPYRNIENGDGGEQKWQATDMT